MMKESEYECGICHEIADALLDGIAYIPCMHERNVLINVHPECGELD